MTVDANFSPFVWHVVRVINLTPSRGFFFRFLFSHRSHQNQNERSTREGRGMRDLILIKILLTQFFCSLILIKIFSHDLTQRLMNGLSRLNQSPFSLKSLSSQRLLIYSNVSREKKYATHQLCKFPLHHFHVYLYMHILVFIYTRRWIVNWQLTIETTPGLCYYFQIQFNSIIIFILKMRRYSYTGFF